MTGSYMHIPEVDGPHQKGDIFDFFGARFEFDGEDWKRIDPYQASEPAISQREGAQ